MYAWVMRYVFTVLNEVDLYHYFICFDYLINKN